VGLWKKENGLGGGTEAKKIKKAVKDRPVFGFRCDKKEKARLGFSRKGKKKGSRTGKRTMTAIKEKERNRTTTRKDPKAGLNSKGD